MNTLEFFSHPQVQPTVNAETIAAVGYDTVNKTAEESISTTVPINETTTIVQFNDRLANPVPDILAVDLKVIFEYAASFPDPLTKLFGCANNIDGSKQQPVTIWKSPQGEHSSQFC